MTIPSWFRPKKKKPKDQSHILGITRLHTLEGHTGLVNSVKWSPDGKFLASGSEDRNIRLWNPVAGMLLHTLEGHTGDVDSVAWSPDGKFLASAEDKTIRLWDPVAGMLLHTLKGHTGYVTSVAWSPDGKLLASGSDDKTVRLWDPVASRLLHTLKGHTGSVTSVEWSPDGKFLAFGSQDTTIRLWDLVAGRLLHTLKGHTGSVDSVEWSPDGKLLASGSGDKTIRLWDLMTGMLLHTLEGHTGRVNSMKWSPDGKLLASGPGDKTIRLWDPVAGRLLHTLEGHTGSVHSVQWSPDGKLLASGSYRGFLSDDGDISIWRTDTWEFLAKLSDLKGEPPFAWHPILPLLVTQGQHLGEIALWQLNPESLLGASASSETVHYTNAKVVLVGDSGVGKSGLGLVLSGQPFTVTESTHGRHVWDFDRQEVSLQQHLRETREVLLWDLAGQPGYRLIHQLHLSEVAVALVVFDAHSETDPFAGVRHWDRALRLAQRIQGSTALPLKKFLVAARTDRGGIGVSAQRIQAVVRELGFEGSFATSAREGWQIGELREAICQAIDWQGLPKVSSTELFRQIKQFLLVEKQQARRLISSIEDLCRTFLHIKDAPAKTPELPSQFETCIGRVESAGLIKRLSFGNLVLLQPELLDAYASALVNAVKDEPDGLGSIAEEQVRAGNFPMSVDERILDKAQENLLLIAMIEDLLRRELALREEGMLVFPSQSTKENFDLPDPEGKAAVLTFEGPVLNIYATLAVRLARSGVFKKQDLWKNAVTYATARGDTCGIYLRNSGEGRGELTLFFDQATSREMRSAFTEYVHQYLERRALPASLNVRYVLTCKNCGAVISDNNIQLRKARNFDWLNCPVCEAHVSLVEDVQQRSAEAFPRTEEMDQVADTQREREVAQSVLQGKITMGDFDVFLCYHSVDKTSVMQIGEQLKEQGILPWLDEWELRPGLPWQPALEKQMKQIKSAAVFVGKRGIGPWQQQEVGVLLNKFVKRRCPVIPVLLQGAPKKPKLPLFLENMTWVDFRLREPDPMQRLLWGITGHRDMEEDKYRDSATEAYRVLKD